MTYRNDFREVEREGWWTLPHIILVFFVLTVVGFGFTFVSDAFDLFSYKFWAPKRENVRREVFTNTQSYVQGKIQNIEQECFAYQKADGAQKLALAGEIRNEASTIDLSKLPMDEQACVQEARGQ